MAQRSTRAGVLNGLSYALIIYGVMMLACNAFQIRFGGLYQAAALFSGMTSTFLMRGISLTIPWQLGRPGSVGTRLLWLWLAVVMALILVGFFAELGSDLSRRVLAAWIIGVPIAFIAVHVVIRYGLLRLFPGIARNRSAVILFVNDAARNLLSKAPAAGYNLIGYFEDREPSRTGGPLADLQHLGSVSSAANYVREQGVEVVFICLPEGAFERGIALINELGDTTASVFYVPDWYIFNMMSAQFYDIQGVPVLEVIETPFYGVDGMLKRLFDIVFASVVLVLSIPLMIAIAVAVKLDSRGPIIFKQFRYGLNGERFYVHKFRSMTVMEEGEQVEQVSRADPRVTRVGRFLRRTSLDEWPQFWTVLKGDMSIVGPRPHAVAHNEFDRRAIQGYMTRHKVKPGVTGWAQVNGYRGETQTLDRMEKRIEYDLEYIREWSPLLDVRIILMTALMISRDENAF